MIKRGYFLTQGQEPPFNTRFLEFLEVVFVALVSKDSGYQRRGVWWRSRVISVFGTELGGGWEWTAQVRHQKGRDTV